jgi:hypothetical protein
MLPWLWYWAPRFQLPLGGNVPDEFKEVLRRFGSA